MCNARKTLSEERIERLCRLNRFSTYVVMKKSKKILDMYREAKVAKEYATVEEEQVINRLMIAAKEKYEKTYILKENEKTGSIDYMLIEVLGTEWADKMIEKVFAKMAEFEANSDTYSEIIRDYYFKEDKMDDVDIQVELNLGRTFYYRMKRAAITLFGILLWNIVVEECISETNIVINL